MSQINPMKPGGGKMELRKQKRKITSEAKPKRTSETREKCRDNDVVSTTGCHWKRLQVYDVSSTLLASSYKHPYVYSVSCYLLLKRKFRL